MKNPMTLPKRDLMGIAPLDLQTLFSQVDKVGKQQAAQREGQALQQTMQGVQLQRKAEEQVQQVSQTQNPGEGAEKVKDRSPGQGGEQPGSTKQKGQNKNSDDDEEQQNLSYLTDPNLGKKINISL